MKKLLFTLLIATALCSCSNKETKTPVYDKFDVDFTSYTVKDVTSDNADYTNTIKTIVNGENDFVNSVTLTGFSQLLTTKFHDSTTLKSLFIGSASADGDMTFNFKNTCHSIKVIAQPYYKTYQYGGNPVQISDDQSSILKVGTETWDVGTVDEINFTSEINSKEFVIDAKSVCISAVKAQRSFIRGLEFYFEKQ